jgi:hypothetical protein
MYFYPDLVTDELITAMHGLPKVATTSTSHITHRRTNPCLDEPARDSALIKNVIARIRQSGDFALRTTLIWVFPGKPRAV